ncbi:ATP-dependent helicase [Marinomonas sp. 2405UD68-3]|uniref:ATP-dependent helicase n=1 Tax=Marinomonas sp. 2405UD68-3 TaxID=3391835 RepID=UPI0039C8CE87
MNQISTQEQQKAIYSPTNKDLLVVASAGSGKTHAICERIKFLVSKGIPSKSILATTFTLKSCADLKKRIGEDLHGVTITNIHKLGFKICSTLSDEPYKVIDGNYRKEIISSIVNELNDMDIEGNGLRLHASINQLEREISVWQNKQISKEVLRKNSQPFFYELYTRYLEKCKAECLLDFDAIITTATSILENDSNARNAAQATYQHIFVDEYQDINPSQEKLLQLLKGKQTNMTVVGDDDQAIYGFRGATSGFFLSFAERNNAEVVNLTKNFRSTKTIVSAAKFAVNSKKALTSQDILEIGTANSIRKIRAKDDQEEALRVVHEIKALSSLGHPLSKMVVLYRNHSHGLKVERTLIEQGISVQVKGSNSFWDTKEIKTCMAILGYLANPCFLNFKLIACNFKGIGQAKAKLAWSDNLDPIQALDAYNSEASSALGECFDKFNHQYCTYDLKSLVKEVLLNPSIYGNVMPEQDAAGSAPSENIMSLCKAIEGIQNAASIDDIIESLILNRETTLDKHGESVQMMTIHSSKGLEFSTVFLVNICNGSFPNLKDKTKIPEEERLLFVAITRAKHFLFMIGRQDRRCTFLDKIPDRFSFDASIPSGKPELTSILTEGCSDNDYELSLKELKNSLIKAMLNTNSSKFSDSFKTLIDKMKKDPVNLLELTTKELGLAKALLTQGMLIDGKRPLVSNFSKALRDIPSELALQEMMSF